MRHLARLLVLLPLALLAPVTSAQARVEERVVAGGEEDFLVVRHLRLEGTQREIARALAGIAAERHGWQPQEYGADELDERRAYFEEHAPLFHQRLLGVADHLGVSASESPHGLSTLGYGTVKAGCTVAYYPPSVTEWGGGVVSRNYDFTTGTFRGQLPRGNELPCTSQPYLLETHPSEGYASLSMCAYDLLGGVIDGINEEGLTIALLADDEVLQRYGGKGTTEPVPGFGVLQIARHILETCKDVAEAEAAFRAAELFYGSIPCHYLVADRFGTSFVWENSPDMEEGFVFPGEGEVQVTTNFMYQLHPDRNDLPRESYRLGSFNRYRTVLGRFLEHGDKVDRDFVRASNRCVAVDVPAPSAPRAVGRTLWHTMYYPEERKLEVDFYLGEGERGIRRSKWMTFRLEADRVAAAPAAAPR